MGCEIENKWESVDRADSKVALKEEVSFEPFDLLSPVTVLTVYTATLALL